MKRVATFFLSMIITFTVISGLELPEKEYVFKACATTEECDAELMAIAKQKEALQATIAENKNDENNIMDQVYAYSDQIQLINNELTIIESSISAVQNDIDILTVQLSGKDQIVKERLVKQQYQLNSNTFLALLSTATSVTDLINKWSALNTLQEYDQKLMQEYYTDKQKQVDLREVQETKKQDIEAKKVEIETTKAERETILATVREKIMEKETAMSGLTTSEADLEAQKDLINLPDPEDETIATPENPESPETPVDPGDSNDNGGTVTPPIPTPASWSLPVGGGGVVTSLYRSQIYYEEFGAWHLGLDIGAYKHAPIYAASKGRVLVSDNFCVEGNKSCNGAFGNLVVISHRDINGMPYVTLYAHLESVHVSVGDYVYGGNQIATMGNTGGSYGSHLHFEVHQNTELFYGDRYNRDRLTIDPLTVLPWHGSWSIRWDA